MKRFILYLVFLLLIASCLVRKSKEVSINEIRPIAIIDEFEDTSFILGSKKVSLSNVPYYLESIDGFVPNIEEEIEDTLSNIKVFRTYFSFEKVESQEIRMMMEKYRKAE